MYDFEDEIKLRGKGFVTPQNTPYSKIMYDYAQYNKMETFP